MLNNTIEYRDIYVNSSNLIGPLPLNNSQYSMALFNTLSTHGQTSLVTFLATFLKMRGKLIYSGLSKCIDLSYVWWADRLISKCFVVNLNSNVVTGCLVAVGSFILLEQ